MHQIISTLQIQVIIVFKNLRETPDLAYFHLHLSGILSRAGQLLRDLFATIAPESRLPSFNQPQPGFKKPHPHFHQVHSIEVIQICLRGGWQNPFSGSHHLIRGFLLTRLRRALGRWWPAVLISSILFALPHMETQVAVMTFPLFLIAVTWSLITIWRKSLIPAIIGHILFNFIQLMVVFYGPAGPAAEA